MPWAGMPVTSHQSPVTGYSSPSPIPSHQPPVTPPPISTQRGQGVLLCLSLFRYISLDFSFFYVSEHPLDECFTKKWNGAPGCEWAIHRIHSCEQENGDARERWNLAVSEMPTDADFIYSQIFTIFCVYLRWTSVGFGSLSKLWTGVFSQFTILWITVNNSVDKKAIPCEFIARDRQLPKANRVLFLGKRWFNRRVRFYKNFYT